MDILNAENVREIRAAVLQACYDNHRQQNHRLRLVQIESFLTSLFFDISKNDLIMILDDLKERGYLEFTKIRDKWTHDIKVGEISITFKGRDLVEKNVSADPAVKFD